jgi:thiol-disulfide isomerase/thioredoxin
MDRRRVSVRGDHGLKACWQTSAWAWLGLAVLVWSGSVARSLAAGNLEWPEENAANHGSSSPHGTQTPAAEVPDISLLYFTQEQCPPCRQMQPMLEHLIDRGFPIQVVDVHAQRNLVQQFVVQRTPTFVLLKDGQELKRHSGVLSSYQVNSLLIDAGYPTDQNVLTKPNALSPIVNFFDRLRPVAKSGERTGRLSQRIPEGPARATDPTASIAASDLTEMERQALSATGRLRIEYQDRGQAVTDFGTATVIHRQGADILLLTCGHVFRDSRGQGTIRVELDFADGQPKETVQGQLLLYDAGAPDVALVAAKTNLPIEPMRIMNVDFRPEPGHELFSVGCDQGAPATVRRGDHLAIVRCGAVQVPGEAMDDRMARKFAVSGRPVVGRSGGGLFTADGYLIGVCNAAVVESNEGRYSAIDNVHAILAQANLAEVLSRPPHQQPTRPTLLASSSPPDPTRIESHSPSGISNPRRQRFLPAIDSLRTDVAQPTDVAQLNPAVIPRMNVSQPTAPTRPPQSLGQSLR